jgi:hypothetical protein
MSHETRAALEDEYVMLAGTSLETCSDGLITSWDDVGGLSQIRLLFRG